MLDFTESHITDEETKIYREQNILLKVTILVTGKTINRTQVF